MLIILKTTKKATSASAGEEEGRHTEQEAKTLRHRRHSDDKNNFAAWNSLVDVVEIVSGCVEEKESVICSHKDVRDCCDAFCRRRRRQSPVPSAAALKLKLRSRNYNNSSQNQQQGKEFRAPPHRITIRTTGGSSSSSSHRPRFKNQEPEAFNFSILSSKLPQGSKFNPPRTSCFNLEKNPCPRNSNIPHPEIEPPYNMRQRISEATMGRVVGREFKLAIRKELTDTDLRAHNARLSMPNGKIIDGGYLTEEEKRILYEKNERLEIKTLVLVMGKNQSGHVEEAGNRIALKKWNMQSCGVCNLNGPSWREVAVMCEEGRLDLKAGDEVEVWGFRVGSGKLCFALVNTDARLG